ncbi:MAG: ABC transporter ATP-binding protein [Actinomycetota bacterium]
MSALLEVRGLAKSFGGLAALGGVDLEVNEGEVLTIIGPNGAGKSSLFNVITGLYTPDAGDALFKGRSLIGMRPSKICELGVARTFQTVHLFPGMTILENAMVGQHCRASSSVIGAVFRGPKTRAEEERVRKVAVDSLAFFGNRLMGYRHEQEASVLSYANRRRLEIARAMATEPIVLLLDEPTAGMNPKESLELAALIKRLRDDKGFTIMMIEHDMKVVKGVSDRVIALDHGVKIAEGDYAAVAGDPAVIEAYLGKGAQA